MQEKAPEVAEQMENFIGRLKGCLEVKSPFTVVSLICSITTSKGVLLTSEPEFFSCNNIEVGGNL